MNIINKVNICVLLLSLRKTEALNFESICFFHLAYVNIFAIILNILQVKYMKDNEQKPDC